MECDIEEMGGQIVESSDGEIVIRAPVKGEESGKIGFRIFNETRSHRGSYATRSRHSAELHSGRIMFFNIQTLIKLSTVAYGAKIESVR
jgi:hypothetical protein